jgi:hypothetical protein
MSNSGVTYIGINTSSSSSGGGWGGLATFFIVLFVVGLGFGTLQQNGYTSHESQVPVIFVGNWLEGEVKHCSTTNRPDRITNQTVNYLFCNYDMSAPFTTQTKVYTVRFYGREKQPENVDMFWDCTKHGDSLFERPVVCKQTGATHRCVATPTGVDCG